MRWAQEIFGGISTHSRVLIPLLTPGTLGSGRKEEMRVVGRFYGRS